MLKFFTLIASLCFCSHTILAQMVLKYKTTRPNTSITLPLNGTVNVTVDWGDGTAAQIFTTTGRQTHTYAASGSFTVTISGTLSIFGDSQIYIGPNLISIQSWDGLGLNSLSSAFRGATALISVPSSLPGDVTNMNSMFYYASSFNQPIGAWNTANVTMMDSMFRGASSFNQPIGAWNTANVTDMSYMFYNASSFNQPIGAWNTAKVTDMSYMFYNASSFNQPIGAWNTANVTDMSYMFRAASSFNQPIGAWNTAKVTDMRWMFENASSFNQPIGAWNTANVTNMSLMFASAFSFNQPIGAWNTAKVTDMSGMFSSAFSFNQPIGAWNTANVTDMWGMFSASLCTENYDNLLNGWAPQAVKSGVTFNAESKYSAASESARATLITKGWYIFDYGIGIDNTKCPLINGVEDLRENTLTQTIEIYPNPSTDVFTVSGNTALGTISIYNSVGMLVYETKTNAAQQSIDFASYEAGIYLVRTGNKAAKLVIE